MIGKIDATMVTQRSVLSVLRLLKPKIVDRFGKTRVGRIFDGGYVMIDDFDGVNAAYSFGISNEVSWDRQIAEMGFDVFQYDHTIEALPEVNDRFHWSKIGISDRPLPEQNLETIGNLVQNNGHAEAELLLKCDIEGYEYAMLATSSPTVLKRFRQIVMEIHHFDQLDDLNMAKRIYDALSKLTANHTVVHVHANNHAPMNMLGGIPVPAVLEITLVRNDRYVLLDSDVIYPTQLDSPCYPFNADYHLGTFVF